ncbi:hypothetical protein GN330_06110 [Nitratireductor sp. CAU 1489]|uniref:N-acetyltransferase domain-containing protein n=1 Tax=Nitratireductor arenosus TaxID=2682096 RepID=A0A844QFQ7_9HYPH|nr:hypothetical protein [Nitratireductor arenosus]MVA96821.1 hypothetical protein [Nitratireductor arenosus]
MSPARSRTGTIRPFEPRDRDAVRKICRKTAYRNLGSRAVFEDDELFADYWCNYYTDHEPESCLVVEEDGAVVGYLFGCVDARRHVKLMSRRIMPPLVAKMLWRLATGRYREPVTRRTIRYLLFRSWKEAPPVPVERFPAHYHCNLLRKAHGGRYYSTMAVIFLDRLKALGVAGLHGQVEEPVSGGPWQHMVNNYKRDDLMDYYAESPSSFHRIVRGVEKPMVNRVWGIKLETYRMWLLWIARDFRI